MRRKALSYLAPPPKLKTSAWAEKYRYVADGPLPGKFSFRLTPFLRDPCDAFDDPRVHTMVSQKCAQIGWTDIVIGNILGKIIHWQPEPVIALFPRDMSCKDWSAEKFEPMIEATPVLRNLIEIKKRSKDQTQTRKRFPGGFLKLVGANSPANLKGTTARIQLVEEPDDCTTNAGDQGDSIKLIRQRGNTYHGTKTIIGGTPTISGTSQIEDEMKLSDQRRWMVPCHECGEEHELVWENVHCQHDPARNHEIYGSALPATAYYVCPHCGALWDNTQKNANARRGHFVATAPFSGVAGWYYTALMVTFDAGRLDKLMEEYLQAKHKFDQGEPGDLIAFWNSKLGRTWEHQSDAPKEDELSERAEDYEALTVPLNGLLLSIGVDVQHDRLAIVIKAWGRKEESWLVLWDELYGNTKDEGDPVWTDLDQYVFGSYQHESGVVLNISAMSIDAGDGGTSNAVYSYVRTRKGRGVTIMAAKGESHNADREIFSRPRQVDYKRTGNKTKSDRFGVEVHMVGGSKAKDLLLGGGTGGGRLQLTGGGPGRMHWYRSVRQDYYAQITSEIKVPSRSNRYKKVWQKKSGVRNEALDCEILALHAARAKRSHSMTEAEWTALEARVKQATLFSSGAQNIVSQPVVRRDEPAPPGETTVATQPQKPAESGFFNAQHSPGSFGSPDWSSRL